MTKQETGQVVNPTVPSKSSVPIDPRASHQDPHLQVPFANISTLRPKLPIPESKQYPNHSNTFVRSKQILRLTIVTEFCVLEQGSCGSELLRI